jgi:hypothetical protein
MKSLIYALAILVLILIFGSSCMPQAEHKGLPESDRFVYDVEPAMLPAFEKAAARIEKASGIVLVDAPGGTPVALIEDSPQGSCADTYITGWFEEHIVTSVFIDVYPNMDGCYDDLGDTLLHELIHSLRRYEGGKPEDDHSEKGVYTAKAWRPVLDESSLTKICEVVDCLRFTPEAL